MGNRKARSRRNLGGTSQLDDERFNTPYFDGPGRAEQRTAIVLPERLFRAVLVDEVERLRADELELRRFFAHFFKPTAANPDEVESWVQDFVRNPPTVVMGYPKTTGTWPCFAIVLAGDEESEMPLSGYVGETQAGENPIGGEDQSYEGAFFDQVYSVYILATHPDQCVYLYHFAKLCLVGARGALTGAGVIDPHYGGGDLNPDEMLLPENVFGRVLTVSCKTLQTVPQVLSYRDGRKLRVTGLFGTDVVVDGMRGGVKACPPGDDDGEQG